MEQLDRNQGCLGRWSHRAGPGCAFSVFLASWESSASLGLEFALPGTWGQLYYLSPRPLKEAAAVACPQDFKPLIVGVSAVKERAGASEKAYAFI